MKTQFVYTNLVPPDARPGTNSNLITLEWDGKNIKYTRNYISRKNGTTSEHGISQTFDANEPVDLITQAIHWGCCGWSAYAAQTWQLRVKVQAFIDSLAMENSHESERTPHHL